MAQFCECWTTYPRCKEDCYWYEEWQDMGGHVPYCRCKRADFIEPKDCENCEQYHSKYKPTNADKIRQMSDEGLAKLFLHLCCPYSLGGNVDCNAENKGCADCWLDWLKQEAE